MAKPIGEITLASVSLACERYGMPLSEEDILRGSTLIEAEAFQYANEEPKKVLRIEKRPRVPAEVVHFRTIAAAKALVHFLEGVVSYEVHPALVWFAVLHMVGSLTEIRRTYSKADADLLYLVYCAMQTGDSNRSLCQQRFEKSWPNVAFDTTLKSLMEVGLIEESEDSLFLREKVFFRTAPPIFE